MKILNQVFSRSSAMVAALSIGGPMPQAQELLVDSDYEEPLLPNQGVNPGWASTGTIARNDMSYSVEYPHPKKQPP